MAKKGQSEQQQLVRRLSDLLRTAKFKVQHQLDLGTFGRPDLVAEREDLGQHRRYAIDVLLATDAKHLVGALDRLQDFAETQKDRDFDEYWLISNLSYPYWYGGPRKRRYENVRAFAVNELERMLAKLNSQKKQPEVKKGPTSKGRTTIGKAVEANKKEIDLAISGLILQIEAKLEVLIGERPNSDEAKTKSAAIVSDLEQMKTELERIRELVDAFTKGKASEKEVVKSVTTFKDGLQEWWSKEHATLLTTAAKSALFVSSVGVLALMKADSAAAIAIAGAVVGGTTVAKAKKIGKKVLDAIQ